MYHVSYPFVHLRCERPFVPSSCWSSPLSGRVFLVLDDVTPGDLNEDNALDIIDVIEELSHILNNDLLSQSQIIIGDINYDTNLDVLDVVLIVEIILN